MRVFRVQGYKFPFKNRKWLSATSSTFGIKRPHSNQQNENDRNALRAPGLPQAHYSSIARGCTRRQSVTDGGKPLPATLSRSATIDSSCQFQCARETSKRNVYSCSPRHHSHPQCLLEPPVPVPSGDASRSSLPEKSEAFFSVHFPRVLCRFL